MNYMMFIYSIFKKIRTFLLEIVDVKIIDKFGPDGVSSFIKKIIN